MVAVKVKNWAHIIKFPLGISESSVMITDRKASTTAAANESTAMIRSMFLCLAMIFYVRGFAVIVSIPRGKSLIGVAIVKPRLLGILRRLEL